MVALEAVAEVLIRDDGSTIPSPADLRAAAFLARYSGRTFRDIGRASKATN